MSCTVKSHPRIPEQDATEAIFLCSLHHDISIHAPLTGCDIVRLFDALGTGIFQSTHPLRDATT